MDTIIENINDYVLSDCTSVQCGFSESEVNEIYSTFACETGEKVLENAVKSLSDEDYDEIVEKIAEAIYIARQTKGKRLITKFTEAVLSRMKELGVKQKDLAAMLGLSRQVVKYKIDNDSFTRQELIKLQDILHMRNSEILSMDKFASLALQAVDDWNRDNPDDKIDVNNDMEEVYVWHWFDEYEDGEPERLQVSRRNHHPEGIRCSASGLANISDWWQDEWNQCPY